MPHKEGQEKSRIPAFAGREQEAEFWDTLSTADYEDEFKPVKVRVAKNLSHGITIRLDPESLQEVRELAQEKGMGPTTLIRMWVMERLKEAKAARQ